GTQDDYERKLNAERVVAAQREAAAKKAKEESERKFEIEFKKLVEQERIDEENQRKKKEAAVQKRKFQLNAKALEIVLQNEESKRDAIAEEITKLQGSSVEQTLLDRLAKKYRVAAREVDKAKADIARHKKGTS
ncbi:MAG: hypothetical protein NTZ08_12755, partial [Verrucomicrobia bacterium]|nr:hypothetical protein [Verrucomicrobiota bacterium]